MQDDFSDFYIFISSINILKTRTLLTYFDLTHFQTY
jgi:hypothetical protein